MLPAPTTQIDQAKADLDRYGICILPDVLDSKTLALAQAALYAAAEDDRQQNNVVKNFGLDTNTSNQRVWNLLIRDPVFSGLAEHPFTLELVRHVIGWPALLSNISGNIAGPGTSLGVRHADQIFVPQPWPDEPQGVNVAWCLDDFTADNGGTLVAPESHKLHRLPEPDDEQIEMVPLIAKAGSAIVFESRVWHQTGSNTTSDEYRGGIFAFYTTPIYRTQENWFLTLDAEFIDNASDDLLTLLAYKTEGFGLVHGRSPR
jgi:ectoine hydroxylase-related dioxygenase (phytanoyl-CoA dioxygenase family)